MYELSLHIFIYVHLGKSAYIVRLKDIGTTVHENRNKKRIALINEQQTGLLTSSRQILSLTQSKWDVKKKGKVWHRPDSHL